MSKPKFTVGDVINIKGINEYMTVRIEKVIITEYATDYAISYTYKGKFSDTPLLFTWDHKSLEGQEDTITPEFNATLKECLGE